MTTNPIRLEIDKKEAERLRQAAGSHLPIHICCILDEYQDYEDPVLHKIREHCINSDVLFTTRLYDSYKYTCDRDYIERLPALHIFVKQLYIKTYYPNTRPLQHIDETVEKYMRSLELKKARKNKWKKYFASLKKWILSLGHRKTRMEKYNEERALDWSKRND
jgi:hypothetical protein